MIVVFTKDSSFASYAIRFFTWSRWHHCGALTRDKKFVIEATVKHGVVKTPVDEFIAKYDEVSFTSIECDDKDAQVFLYDQVGKKYDFKAIFSILFRRKWQSNNRWFCSELVAGASGLFRKERSARITPEHIWMISKEAQSPSGEIY